jgi:hypothetical protein
LIVALPLPLVGTPVIHAGTPELVHAVDGLQPRLDPKVNAELKPPPPAGMACELGENEDVEPASAHA